MYTTDRRKQLNSDRINTLVPELQKPCLEGISSLEEAGYEPLVVEARRTQEYQNSLYAQGRQSLEDVNQLRDLAGYDPISEEENNHIVTNTTFSKHILGKAFDIVAVVNGEVDWDDDNFIALSSIVFEKLKLTWGGRFIHGIDNDHFELP